MVYSSVDSEQGLLTPLVSYFFWKDNFKMFIVEIYGDSSVVSQCYEHKLGHQNKFL